MSVGGPEPRRPLVSASPTATVRQRPTEDILPPSPGAARRYVGPGILFKQNEKRGMGCTAATHSQVCSDPYFVRHPVSATVCWSSRNSAGDLSPSEECGANVL